MSNDKKRKPTLMPEWVEKQFENAEKPVDSWPDSKREAAGIPVHKMSNETKNRVMHQNAPTEPGFYWCAYNEHLAPEVVEVIWCREGNRLIIREWGDYVCEIECAYWSDKLDEWVMPEVEE